MAKPLARIVKEHKSLLLLMVLMTVFRSSLADWNTVPTGSMKPTIVEGDRIFVNKTAYDIRIPLTRISLYKLADPVTGDIVVFDSEASGKRMVKRVVGVPGDVVELKSNRLLINGQHLAYTPLNASATEVNQLEELAGEDHFVRFHKLGSRLSSFSAVTVPPGHYLAMGDNRDNSADSRVYGFVPRAEIVGRTRHVVMSLDYDNYYLPRSERFFLPL